MGKKDNPCYQCTERSDHCHGRCERHATCKARLEELRMKRNLKRDVDWAVGDAMKRIPGKRGI